MPPISVPPRTVARFTRRLGLILGGTALATLAVAACGSETTGGGRPEKTTAGSVGDLPSSPPSGEDAELAFLFLLTTVGEPCLPDDFDEEPTAPGDPFDEPPMATGEMPPTGPVQLPVDASPPTDVRPPSDTPATPEERELGGPEKCEGRLHVKRVTKALSGLVDPTPARVGAALNHLGYPDGRIHGLKRTGTAVRFFVDLRFMGGSLCLNGSVTGTGAVVEAFAAPETGPFSPGEREGLTR